MRHDLGQLAVFKRTVIARVGLPKSVWEPIRALRDHYDVPLEYLAQAWRVDTGVMLKVIYAARLQNLENGEEVSGAELLEKYISEMRD